MFDEAIIFYISLNYFDVYAIYMLLILLLIYLYVSMLESMGDQ